MFFREKKTSSRPTLQLVENRRDAEGKVRQRVVVSLAGCWVPDRCRRAVADELGHRMAGYGRILPEDDPEVAEWTNKVVARLEEAGKLPAATHRELGAGQPRRLETLDVEAMEHELGAELGPFLVLLRAWRSLGLDEALDERGFSVEQLAAAKMAVFNRLVEPCAENELPNWVGATALGDLLGVRPVGWAEDRFYRVGDKLLAARKVLEPHLRNRERELFNLDRTILLYDLTNSYFEGSAEKNPLARRSVNSKEKRGDCPLISVGLVLDAEGFPLTHQVFAGNVSDCRTLLRAVGELERLAGGGDQPPLVVMDGGMATKANLRELRARGYDYVVNGKRQTRGRFAEDFLDRDSFTRVEGRAADKDKQPVFVRRLRVDGETLVLCRSDGRRDKEDAILAGAERRLVEGLEKLHARILRGDPRLKLDAGPTLVERAIGNLAARATRAAKHYRVAYRHEARTLSWERLEPQWRDATELHGCYHLRSSVELGDQEIWKIYITLTRVEDAFRQMKSELGLRPFHHQLDRRCRAHIWITVLAYHLQRWIEYSLRLAGYQTTWSALRRRLRTHCYATLIVPTQTGFEYHIRKPGRPNEVQRLVYSLLQIDHTALPIQRRTYKTSAKCTKM